MQLNFCFKLLLVYSILKSSKRWALLTMLAFSSIGRTIILYSLYCDQKWYLNISSCLKTYFLCTSNNSSGKTRSVIKIGYTLLSDQESSSVTADQETNSNPAMNQESNSTENEFPSAILLLKKPIRSEDDFDMLEDLPVVLNEDRTNGANPDSLEDVVIYELMKNKSAITPHIIQEDTQCTRKNLKRKPST